jgi:hypothetical protein
VKERQDDRPLSWNGRPPDPYSISVITVLFLMLVPIKY